MTLSAASSSVSSSLSGLWKSLQVTTDNNTNIIDLYLFYNIKDNSSSSYQIVCLSKVIEKGMVTKVATPGCWQVIDLCLGLDPAVEPASWPSPGFDSGNAALSSALPWLPPGDESSRPPAAWLYHCSALNYHPKNQTPLCWGHSYCCLHLEGGCMIWDKFIDPGNIFLYIFLNRAFIIIIVVYYHIKK